MSSFGSHDLYRSTLINCLNLACTRVHEARLQALKTAFSALKSNANASSLSIVETAAARVETEERRRLKIIAALKQRSDSTQAA